MIKKLAYILLLFCPAFCLAQSKIDSLQKELKLAVSDTQRIKILMLCATAYGSNEPEKSLEFVNKADAITNAPDYPVDRKEFKKFKAQVLRGQGVAYYFLGEYNPALDKLHKSLALYQELKNDEGQAGIYGWIGNAHYSKGDFQKALEAMLQSLKLQEKMGSLAGLAGSMNGVANIYRSQHDLKKALEYYYKSLELRLQTGDSINIAYSYNNIGLIYAETDSLSKSLACHLKCLRIVERFEDKKGMANSYGNIGEIYNKKKQYKEALASLFKSLKISEEISDKNGICASYSDIGKTYYNSGDLKNALSWYLKGFETAKEIGDKDAQKDCAYGLAVANYSLKDFKNAASYLEQYTSLKDSLLNQSNIRNIEEMQTRFETEKKEKEIELLQKDQNIRELQLSEQEANIKRQRILIYSVVGGLLLVVGLIFFIWKSYREKKKINQGLEKKNIEISIQKDLIAEKNLLITDSIDYARTIQQAVLPSDGQIEAAFPHSFKVFLPKDIVSGDFYWLHEKEDTWLFAVVDCTGHGVPGAFMSVMAYNMLENIVSGKEDLRPAHILDQLNRSVLSILHQEHETSSAKYGMDISLIAFDKRARKLQFAGAHNSLIIIKPNSTFAEYKADRTTVGMAQQKFTNHEIIAASGDMLYLFTDGYADQRGGPDNRKYFLSEFKKLLTTLAPFDPDEQKMKLTNVFDNWKGKKDQIDDVLIVGIKV